MSRHGYLLINTYELQQNNQIMCMFANLCAFFIDLELRKAV